MANTEHDGFWVATGYRYPTKRVAPGAAVDAKDMAPLTGLVVKSLITAPLDGAVVPPGPVTVAGFAWAGETDIAQGRRLGRRRRHVAAGTSSPAQADEVRVAAFRVRLRRDQAGDAHDPVARHRREGRRRSRSCPQWNPSGYLWNAPDQVRIEVKA